MYFCVELPSEFGTKRRAPRLLFSQPHEISTIGVGKLRWNCIAGQPPSLASDHDYRQEYVVPQDPLMAPSTTCVVRPECCCCDDADEYLVVVVSRRSRLVSWNSLTKLWRGSDPASGSLICGVFRTSKSRRPSSRNANKTKRLGRSDWSRLQLPARCVLILELLNSFE